MSWVSQDNRSLWTVTATASQSGYPASNVADGNTGTSWWSGANIPQSLMVDRAGNAGTSIDTMLITPVSGDYPKACTVYHSDDGSTWTQIGSASGWPSDATDRFLNFTATTKRYIKVTFTASSGSWVRVAELYLGIGGLGNVRSTQAVTEAVYQGTPKVRVTQVATEALFTGNPKARVSQVVVEVVFRNPKTVYPKIQQFILP